MTITEILRERWELAHERVQQEIQWTGYRPGPRIDGAYQKAKSDYFRHLQFLVITGEA